MVRIVVFTGNEFLYGNKIQTYIGVVITRLNEPQTLPSDYIDVLRPALQRG